jgi:hypothetical protein
LKFTHQYMLMAWITDSTVAVRRLRVNKEMVNKVSRDSSRHRQAGALIGLI